MIARLQRLASTGRRLLSDRDVQDGVVEFRIALAQALLIGAPIVLISIGIMAVLP
jgi:hypothetical protein